MSIESVQRRMDEYKLSSDADPIFGAYAYDDLDIALDVIAAAKRVIAWMANDPYTQLEKIDGAMQLALAVEDFEAAP